MAGEESSSLGARGWSVGRQTPAEYDGGYYVSAIALGPAQKQMPARCNKRINFNLKTIGCFATPGS